MTRSLAGNCELCTLHKLFTTYIQIMTLHFIEIIIKFKVSTICNRYKTDTSIPTARSGFWMIILAMLSVCLFKLLSKTTISHKVANNWERTENANLLVKALTLLNVQTYECDTKEQSRWKCNCLFKYIYDGHSQYSFDIYIAGIS